MENIKYQIDREELNTFQWLSHRSSHQPTVDILRILTKSFRKTSKFIEIYFISLNILLSFVYVFDKRSNWSNLLDLNLGFHLWLFWNQNIVVQEHIKANLQNSNLKSSFKVVFVYDVKFYS